MSTENLLPSGAFRGVAPLNARCREDEGLARRRGIPTSSQISSTLQLIADLSARRSCAALVCGPCATGKSTAIRASVRLVGRKAMFYQCTNGSNANQNLQSLSYMLEHTQSESDGPEPLALVVEHVERSTCKEALTQGVKRLAADAGAAVIFEVNDDVHGSDTLYAYCRRTRGILTHAPLTVSRMTSRDAVAVARYSWASRYPGRHMPEYLGDTVRGIIDGKIGAFADLWRFAVSLFDDASFVEPARLWEYKRPQRDDYYDPAPVSPLRPDPFYPDAHVIMEVEEYLDAFTDCVRV